MKKSTALLGSLLGIALLSGCSGIAKSLGDSLSAGVLNHDDPATVAEALPSYLIMLDGLIERDPESATLLRAAAELYGAYSGSFVDDEERAGKLAVRARDYGQRALCLKLEKLCDSLQDDFDIFQDHLNAIDDPDDLPWLFGWASAMAVWIQTNSSDYLALAQVPKVSAAVERIVAVDPNFRNGQPWIYLGVLATQLPPSVGGKPEEGRRHFEKAIELSDGNNLLAKVLFARFYARMVFNQELHDQLLNEVLAAPVKSPGHTLTNVLAKEEARELLASGKDYF